MNKLILIALLAGLVSFGCKEDKKEQAPAPVEQMNEEPQEVNEMPSEEMNEGATEEMPEDMGEETESTSEE